MKIKLELEGDFYEDTEIFKRIMVASEMYGIIEEVRDHIRSRLKYGENVSNEEERTLLQIREILYIDEM